MKKHLSSKTIAASVSTLVLSAGVNLSSTYSSTVVAAGSQPIVRVTTTQYQTQHRSTLVNGLEIFYREAGAVDALTILLLHGFPTSSHRFRNLIPALSDRFHVIVLDYLGFGNSDMPSVESHMCELLEQGFEAAVVKDATAAAQVAEGDGYESALVNFRFIANAAWKTEEAMQALAHAK